MHSISNRYSCFKQTYLFTKRLYLLLAIWFGTGPITLRALSNWASTHMTAWPTSRYFAPAEMSLT